MAKATINLPGEFIDGLETISKNFETIAEKALTKAAGEVLPKFAANLARSIGQDTQGPSRSTGTLQNALGITKVRVDKKGNYNIKIGFAENRKDGRPNALVANVLEYGRSNQKPRPFLKPTKNQSRKKAIEAMKNEIAKQIDKNT